MDEVRLLDPDLLPHLPHLFGRVYLQVPPHGGALSLGLASDIAPGGGGGGEEARDANWKACVDREMQRRGGHLTLA